MIFSRAKLQDMKARELILEGMEVALRHGHTDIAKSLGESSKKMKEKIDTYDYKREDAWLEKEKNIFKSPTV